MKKSFAAAAREEIRRQIKKSLIEGGVDFSKDFLELSCDTTDKIYSLAVVAGYRKKYNPNCYLCEHAQRAYGFFNLLKKIAL